MSKSKKQLKARIDYLERSLIIEEHQWHERYRRQYQEFEDRTRLLREQLNKLIDLKIKELVTTPPVYMVMDLANKEDKKI